MAYRSVSNWRETATAKTTEAGETVRRTYLWERNEKGEKVLKLDQTIDQQAEIDSYLEDSYRDWETDRKSTRLNSSHRS